MTISSLIANRLVTGLGALAIVGSLAGGTAIAAKPAPKNDNPVRELRHEMRDQSKAEREQTKELRKQLAAEYAKDKPNAAKMKRLHKKVQAKHAAAESQRFSAVLDIHDELDAKQRQRVAERMAAEGEPGKDKAGKRDKDKAGKRDKDKAGKRGKDKAGKRDKDKAGKRDKDKDSKHARAERKGKPGKGKAHRPGKGKERRPA
ncbi:hypothetical protein [Enhygromyxa salina]|nr:hypothetical protein [Enhygromyxa salina]